MHLYLESMDLFEHADGLAVAPSGSGAASLRNFSSCAKKAWTYICLAVEPKQQIHVRHTETAKEAWDALKSQFTQFYRKSDCINNIILADLNMAEICWNT